MDKLIYSTCIDITICPIDANTIDKVISSLMNKSPEIMNVLGIIISNQFFYSADLEILKHTDNHYSLKFINDKFDYWIVFIKHPYELNKILIALTNYNSYQINNFDLLTDERKSSNIAVVTSFEYEYN